MFEEEELFVVWFIDPKTIFNANPEKENKVNSNRNFKTSFYKKSIDYLKYLKIN